MGHVPRVTIRSQFFTPVIMHFQWDGPNTTVTRPVGWLWQLTAQTMYLGSGYIHEVPKCCNPQFLPPKMEQSIFNGLAKCLTHSISAIMRDRMTVSKDHLYEIIRCTSISHMTDDVTITWPQKVKVMTPNEIDGWLTDDITWPRNVKVKVMTQYVWDLISHKLCEIGGWFKLTTNTDIASLMTSRDPKRSTLRLQNLWGIISWQPCKIDGGFRLITYRKPYYCESCCVVTDEVTCPKWQQFNTGCFIGNQQWL